jgi:hypothetical protein
MEDRFPFLVHRAQGRHFFPQYALLESILRLVQADLEAAAKSTTLQKPAGKGN